MLVKSGTGSISMVGGFVISPPQQQSDRHTPANPLATLLHQLLRRQK